MTTAYSEITRFLQKEAGFSFLRVLPYSVLKWVIFPENRKMSPVRRPDASCFSL